MSKQFNKMKRQIASKMGGRAVHGFTCPHCHGYHTTKGASQEWFKAKINKKKLPFNTKRLPEKTSKDPKYAKLSIDKFLERYPEWKV